jgi:energy-coupling factor transport system substrate-specific component
MTGTANKLTGKDLINVGIYTVIYFVIMMLVGWLGYMPIFIPLMAVLVPLLGGIPFMLFLTKVKKFGMVLIMGILVGITMLLGGMGYWSIPTGAIAGLLAELILRAGKYQSKGKSILACAVFSTWVIGNFIPFYIGRDSYIAELAARFNSEYAATIAGYMPGWMLPALLAAGFVFGLLGGFLGQAICKKHFVRAGIVE